MKMLKILRPKFSPPPPLPLSLPESRVKRLQTAEELKHDVVSSVPMKEMKLPRIYSPMLSHS